MAKQGNRTNQITDVFIPGFFIYAPEKLRLRNSGQFKQLLRLIVNAGALSRIWWGRSTHFFTP
jgi:hypothetical protein